MNTILRKIVWLFIAAPAGYLALVWNRIPEKVAMHYDLHGNPDRFGSRRELIIMVIVLVVVNILSYLMITNMYRIDPKRYAAENKPRLYKMGFAVAVFLAAITCMMLYTNVQGNMPLRTGMILAAVGLLFAILGNYMPNLKPNYFAGLRLPWTLENEENWRLTHQLAGKLWFAGGLLIAVVCLFSSNLVSIITFFVITAIIVIIPFIFSYRLYKKQKNAS